MRPLSTLFLLPVLVSFFRPRASYLLLAHTRHVNENKNRPRARVYDLVAVISDNREHRQDQRIHKGEETWVGSRKCRSIGPATRQDRVRDRCSFLDRWPAYRWKSLHRARSTPTPGMIYSDYKLAWNSYIILPRSERCDATARVELVNFQPTPRCVLTDSTAKKIFQYLVIIGRMWFN